MKRFVCVSLLLLLCLHSAVNLLPTGRVEVNPSSQIKIGLGVESSDKGESYVIDYFEFWGIEWTNITDFSTLNIGDYDLLIYPSAYWASRNYLTQAELDKISELFGSGTSVCFLNGYDAETAAYDYDGFEIDVFGINMTSRYESKVNRKIYHYPSNYNTSIMYGQPYLRNDTSDFVVYRYLRNVSSWEGAKEIFSVEDVGVGDKTYFTVNTENGDKAHLIQEATSMISKWYSDDTNKLIAMAAFRYVLDEVSIRVKNKYVIPRIPLYASFMLDDGNTKLLANKDELQTFYTNNGIKWSILFWMNGLSVSDDAFQVYLSNNNFMEVISHSWNHSDHTKYNASYLQFSVDNAYSKAKELKLSFAKHYITFMGHNWNSTILDYFSQKFKVVLGFPALYKIPNIADISLDEDYKGMRAYNRISLDIAISNNETDSVKSAIWRNHIQNTPIIFYAHGYESANALYVVPAVKSLITDNDGKICWLSEQLKHTVETGELFTTTSSGTKMNSTFTSIAITMPRESHVIIPVTSDMYPQNLWYYNYSNLQIDIFPLSRNPTITLMSGASSTPHIISLNQEALVETAYEQGNDFVSYVENRLTIIVNSPSGTTSTTKVYVGDKGEPKAVHASNGTLSWSYSASTKILTLNIVHASSVSILVDWRIPGDVNGDGKVDVSDLFDSSASYGSDLSKPNWNPDCDFNWDGKVDASDLFDLSKNYGYP